MSEQQVQSTEMSLRYKGKSTGIFLGSNLSDSRLGVACFVYVVRTVLSVREISVKSNSIGNHYNEGRILDLWDLIYWILGFVHVCLQY
jgi:hypothetical protein